jgi:nucleoid DNA-binding protein
MYNSVRKYFAQHQHLVLPGIGHFSVETKPAQIDLAARTITSPQKKIIFTGDKLPAEEKFYNFLAHELNTDEVQAIRLFTDFTSQLQNELTKKNNIYFKDIGTLTKQTSNVILFQPDETSRHFPQLPAERIIRKNITHTVRVGEQEKTSEEMQAALNQPQTIKKERWWIAAAILAAIGIAAIVLYYAMN